MAQARRTRTVTGAVVLIAGLGLVGAPAAQADGSPELRIDFRRVNGTLSDGSKVATAGSARTTAVLRTHAGGLARKAAGAYGGRALRLPAFDADARRSTVPLAVLGVTGGGLDPGSRPFRFGAAFKLDATGNSAVDNGENLVQRGRYGDNSQYKLQIDKGRPSCRVKGSRGAVMVSAPKVARKRWYEVSCRRARSHLRLTLTRHRDDGSKATRSWTTRGRTGKLPALSRRTPLSVGGKLNREGEPMRRDSDQFNGVIDSIFVDIER